MWLAGSLFTRVCVCVCVYVCTRAECTFYVLLGCCVVIERREDVESVMTGPRRRHGRDMLLCCVCVCGELRTKTIIFASQRAPVRSQKCLYICPYIYSGTFRTRAFELERLLFIYFKHTHTPKHSNLAQTSAHGTRARSNRERKARET